MRGERNGMVWGVRGGSKLIICVRPTDLSLTSSPSSVPEDQRRGGVSDAPSPKSQWKEWRGRGQVEIRGPEKDIRDAEGRSK